MANEKRCEYCKDGKSFIGARVLIGNDGKWHEINHCPNCGAKMDGGNEDAETIKILARHLMQCGMLMPSEWVQKNGEDSEFMQAYKMAMDALKNEPVRCIAVKMAERYEDAVVEQIAMEAKLAGVADCAVLNKAAILEALQKQIPQRPDLEADGYSDGELVYDTGYCPRCRKDYEIEYQKPNYCENCGQALDWEGIE